MIWDTPEMLASKNKAEKRGGYEASLLANCADRSFPLQPLRHERPSSFFFSSSSFLEDEKFKEVSKALYSPSNEDIMRCRTVTKTARDVKVPLDDDLGR